MLKDDSAPRNRRFFILLAFLAGMGMGLSWALRLDEERRRRIRKNLFELRELPFRFLI